jgi:hypothetical protein
MYSNWGFIGVQEWLEHRILRRPMMHKVTCTLCNGSGACVYCDGKGCAQCNGDGNCPECHGEGELKERADEKKNT